MGDRDVFIQNVHTNGVRVRTLDGKTERRFPIEVFDHETNRLVETGYTRISGEEYQALLEGSPLFRKFIEWKKLVVHDELPPEAQTAHEALVSARKETGKVQADLEAARQDVTRLQGELEAARKETGKVQADLEATRQDVARLQGELVGWKAKYAAAIEPPAQSKRK